MTVSQLSSKADVLRWATVKVWRLRVLVCALTVMAVLPAPASASRDIGVTAAVRPDVLGTPPEQESRILHVGTDLSENERVETSAIGQTHLLFRDGSSLSIGPRASVVLDKFVYDPETKTGELVVSASKGVLRFVGGRISKTRPVLIKTPTAVIGVRGGVAMMSIADPQQNPGQPPATVTMLYGEEVFMESGGNRQTMRRPGFTMSQTPDGGFTPPAPVTQQQLNEQLATLEDPPPPPEDDGPQALGDIAPAAGGGVSDNDVAQTQLSELGSGNDPSDVSSEPQSTPPASTSSSAGDGTTEDASQNLAMESTEELLGSQIPEETEETPPSTPEPPVVETNQFSISNITDIDLSQNVIAENAVSGTTVGVTAFANDDDPDDSVFYNLGSGSGTVFAINRTTGVVTVIGPVDFETATSHTISLVGTSDDGSASSLNVTIAVTDDNTEFTATMPADNDSGANSVSESAPIGATVGITAQADDFDGTDSVVYSLLDNAGGRFAIDTNSGVISVLNPALLDAETALTHTVVVQATSTDGSSSQSTFAIGLLDDVTEFSLTTIVDSDAAANLALDSAANGATVGFTAFSNDADVTDTTIYSLDQDGGGTLAIDPSTGVITIADASQIDYKTSRTLTIAPRAANSSGTSLNFHNPYMTTINVGYNGFVGRFKRGNGSQGTNDTDTDENFGVPDILLSGNDLTATVPQGSFDLTVPQAGNVAGVGPGDTIPFSCCTNDIDAGFMTADQEFLYYTITEFSNGQKDILFAGDPTTTFPTTGSTAYTLGTDFPRSSELGLISYTSPAPPSNGVAYIRWEQGSQTAQRPFGGGIVYIQGQGGTQTSGAFFMSGQILADDGVSDHIGGSFFGTTDFQAFAGVSRFFDGPLASSDAADGSDFFGLAAPNYFVLESASVDESESISTRGATRDTGGTDFTYYPNVPAFRDNSATFANDRTPTTWSGFAAGLEVRTSGNVIVGFDYLKTASDSAGNIVLFRNPTENTMNAVFLLEQDVSNRSLDIRFGTGNTDGTGAYIDDKRFYAQGTTTTVNGASVGSQHGMATSDIFVFDNFLPNGVSLCSCNFVTWGFWGANRVLEVGSPFRAHTHLGTWVAGELANSAHLVGIAPQSATYSGHVIAGMQDGTEVYQAAGAIALQFSFGAGNYSLDSVDITDFDGVNYSSSVGSAGSFGNSEYNSGTAGLTITGVHPTFGGVGVTLTGAFFGTGTPPEETAGHVRFSGDGYGGIGTYAAARP